MNKFAFLLAIFPAMISVEAAAGDALCDRVKDKVQNARCHCATENGGVARLEGTSVKWTGFKPEKASAFNSCKTKRGG
ncbi:MAG: hypothetical protein ACRDBH_04245 [Bosea sp. (in: a-proteobacteria)]